MDFDGPDVMKDFPGLYASELNKQCSNDSDYSDEIEKVMKKDLIGKRKEKKDKERGYAALEGESSAEENIKSRSPSKSKKAKSFKFTSKAKDKRDKSREKDKELEKKKEKEKKLDKKGDKEKVKSEKVKKFKVDGQGDIGDVLPIFGVTLELAVERGRCHDNVAIPLPIRECVDYIESVGINFEGVYKISGTKSKVLHLRKMYNQREIIKFCDYDVPTITSLVKTFLRDLPEPIFTNDLLIRFEEAGAILNANTREKHLKIMIENLPPCNKLLLAWLIIHLDNVSLNERCNKMSKQSIAAALNHTFHCSSRLLLVLLNHSCSLFKIQVLKYIPPLESGASLPDNPEEIQEELDKQESLLSQIHQEMNVCCISKQREELLWEVQRIITQLKRKLKIANKDKDKDKETNQPLPQPKPIEEIKEVERVIEDVIKEPEETVISDILKDGSPIEPQVFEETSEVIPEQVNEDSQLDQSLALLKLKNDGLLRLRENLMTRIQGEFKEIAVLKEQISGEYSAVGTIPSEKLDEVIGLLLKENQALQIKKVNLVRQIIEEQEMCIELKAQLVSKV